MDGPTPPPFLQGEDIYLRKLTAQDVTESYVGWMNSEEVTRYLESGFFPQSIKELQEYAEEQSKKQDVVFLSIVKTDTDEHIGNIKLGAVDWIHRRAEIGLIIGQQKVWGHGYGTEAVKLLTAYGLNRLNLRKITAHCYEPNDGSKRVFEKAGYESEALLKEHVFCNGEYVDVCVYSCVQEE